MQEIERLLKQAGAKTPVDAHKLVAEDKEPEGIFDWIWSKLPSLDQVVPVALEALPFLLALL
jgi:hypothetical protein